VYRSISGQAKPGHSFCEISLSNLKKGKGIKLDVAGGSASFTNDTGTVYFGIGYERQSLLVASLSSKPVGLEVSEAATAFNVEGLQDDTFYIANTVSESIISTMAMFYTP